MLLLFIWKGRSVSSSIINHKNKSVAWFEVFLVIYVVWMKSYTIYCISLVVFVQKLQKQLMDITTKFVKIFRFCRTVPVIKMYNVCFRNPEKCVNKCKWCLKNILLSCTSPALLSVNSTSYFRSLSHDWLTSDMKPQRPALMYIMYIKLSRIAMDWWGVFPLGALGYAPAHLTLPNP